MSDYTLSVILSIVRDLVYTVLFLGCVAVSYFTLQQPRVRQLLAKATLLVKAVVFVAIAGLLYSTIDGPVVDILFFPKALLEGDNALYATVDCCGGILVIAGLAAGIGLLTRQQNESEE